MEIPKLKVIGAKVLAKNSFGLIYKLQSSEKLELLKLTYDLNGNIIRRDKISGFESYTQNEHFIYLWYAPSYNKTNR